MYWKPTQQLDNGRYLAVAIKIMGEVYQEFAGVGCSEAEAKTKAVARMWRESRRTRNLPDEHEPILVRPAAEMRRSLQPGLLR